MSAKVTLVVPSFPRTSETFIVSKFLGLLERGYDVKVICGSSDSKEWARFPGLDRSELKRRVLLIPPALPRWRAALYFLPVLLKTFVQRPAATVRYLRRGWPLFGPGIFKRLYLDVPLIAEQPDLIHFEFGAIAVGREYLKQLLDAKILVSFRGYDISFVGLENPQHYAKVWEHADRLHFRSNDLRNRALQRGCPPGKLFTIIPPGINVEDFSPVERRYFRLGTNEHPIHLVSVGRLEWKKGYEYALQCVALLREYDLVIEYRILGAGSNAHAVKFCAHDLGLGDNVKFIGAVPANKVREHLAWADIFLHASVSEGFSNAILEAQAMQLPIVTSDSDGAYENVLDGVTGFVVPRRNPQFLAEKISTLAAQPGLRKKMGSAGRERIIEHFQSKYEIDAFSQLYARLLDEMPL